MAKPYWNNHTVTASYLSAWKPLYRIDRMTGKSCLRNPKKVGFQPGYWSKKDAALRAWIEDKFSKIEAPSKTLITSLCATSGRHDISLDNRHLLAEFITIHIMRSPSWRAHVSICLDHKIDSLIGSFPVGKSDRAAVANFIKSDDALWNAMVLWEHPRVVQMAMSMRWRFIRLAAPLLMTSDRPVCIVPKSYGMNLDNARRISAVPPNGDFLASSEWSMALAPNLLMVLTWEDKPDTEWYGFDSNNSNQMTIATSHNAVVCSQSITEFYCQNNQINLVLPPHATSHPTDIMSLFDDRYIDTCHSTDRWISTAELLNQPLKVRKATIDLQYVTRGV